MQRTNTKHNEAPASDDSTEPPLQLTIPNTCTHTYGTRASKQFRRPGQDVGINWQDARKEREAANAAQTDKKTQDELKKQKAWAHSQHEEQGIKHVAALEVAHKHK